MFSFCVQARFGRQTAAHQLHNQFVGQRLVNFPKSSSPYSTQIFDFPGSSSYQGPFAYVTNRPVINTHVNQGNQQFGSVAPFVPSPAVSAVDATVPPQPIAFTSTTFAPESIVVDEEPEEVEEEALPTEAPVIATTTTTRSPFRGNYKTKRVRFLTVFFLFSYFLKFHFFRKIRSKLHANQFNNSNQLNNPNNHNNSNNPNNQSNNSNNQLNSSNKHRSQMDWNLLKTLFNQPSVRHLLKPKNNVYCVKNKPKMPTIHLAHQSMTKLMIIQSPVKKLAKVWHCAACTRTAMDISNVQFTTKVETFFL